MQVKREIFPLPEGGEGSIRLQHVIPHADWKDEINTSCAISREEGSSVSLSDHHCVCGAGNVSDELKSISFSAALIRIQVRRRLGMWPWALRSEMFSWSFTVESMFEIQRTFFYDQKR